MNTVVIIDEDDSDTFVVRMSQGNCGKYLVRSIELSVGDIKNKYSFCAGRPADEVFVGKLANDISKLLAELTQSQGILPVPSFVYFAPELLLSGLRIVFSKTEDGSLSAVLRFKHYIGAIKRSFVFEPSMSADPVSVRERIAVDVLHDIVAPMFGLLSLTEPSSRNLLSSHGDAIASRLDRLAGHQKEISFYVGLLQRYVAGCQLDAVWQAGHPSQEPQECRNVLPSKLHSHVVNH